MQQAVHTPMRIKPAAHNRTPTWRARWRGWGGWDCVPWCGFIGFLCGFMDIVRQLSHQDPVTKCSRIWFSKALLSNKNCHLAKSKKLVRWVYASCRACSTSLKGLTRIQALLFSCRCKGFDMHSQQVSVHRQMMSAGVRIPKTWREGGWEGGASMVGLLHERDGALLYHVSHWLHVFVWIVKR